MKSHVFVKFAQEKYDVASSKSNSALFNALYEEGKNISLSDVLVQIGKDDLGLPEGELHTYLESGEGVSAVKDEIKKGQQNYQISGVPFFIIQKDGGDDPPYGLSGAQSHETFVKLFEELTRMVGGRMLLEQTRQGLGWRGRPDGGISRVVHRSDEGISFGHVVGRRTARCETVGPCGDLCGGGEEEGGRFDSLCSWEGTEYDCDVCCTREGWIVSYVGRGI